MQLFLLTTDCIAQGRVRSVCLPFPRRLTHISQPPAHQSAALYNTRVALSSGVASGTAQGVSLQPCSLIFTFSPRLLWHCVPQPVGQYLLPHCCHDVTPMAVHLQSPTVLLRHVPYGAFRLAEDAAFAGNGQSPKGESYLRPLGMYLTVL